MFKKLSVITAAVLSFAMAFSVGANAAQPAVNPEPARCAVLEEENGRSCMTDDEAAGLLIGGLIVGGTLAAAAAADAASNPGYNPSYNSGYSSNYNYGGSSYNKGSSYVFDEYDGLHVDYNYTNAYYYSNCTEVDGCIDNYTGCRMNTIRVAVTFYDCCGYSCGTSYATGYNIGNGESYFFSVTGSANACSYSITEVSGWAY